MNETQMVIFTRLFDMLAWLLLATNHFPRAHRHTFTQRILATAFDLHDCLHEANSRKGAARLERLERADEALAKLRSYVRLAVRWQWLSVGQYQHVAEMLAEVGNLLGGWQRQTKTKID